MPKAASGRARASKPTASPAKETLIDLPELTGTDEDWFSSVDDGDDWVNALLWGREGATKTTAAAHAASLPGDGKVLIVNAEGGLKKVALRRQGVDTSKIRVYPNPATGETLTREGLLRIYTRVHADLLTNPTSWSTVVFDSITEIVAQLLGVVTDKRNAFLKDQGKRVDPDFVDVADYGVLTKQVRDVLRKFRDLPCHFIATALERRDVDADTAKPTYGPDLPPAIASTILGYVDMVLLYRAPDDDKPARALCHGSARYRAKDRFGVLPKVLAEPSFDRIVAYVQGQLTPDTDPLQDLLKSTPDPKAS